MADGATSVGKIGLDLVVNQGQFNSQLNSISGIAKKAGTALAAAFSVKKLVDFGKSCIDLGSDLNEVQNVVDVVFTSMSDKVNEFAQNAAASYGLSETMAKKYTGTFGAMAKAFGFNEQAAYDMSTALTGLTGDVASFYNISQDEAYTKLKSVFTGETESLKDLGVVMTQTALDSYALANGYGKTTSAMTEAEKVSLRYAFVQDQLTSAAGDFARTSGSWANQVKILSLQFESFKATIGQGLINVFTPVIRVVNILIGRLLTLANAFKIFTGYFSSGSSSKAEKSTSKIANNANKISTGFSAATGAATSMASAGTKAANKVGKAAEKASKKVRSLMGFDQINKLSDDTDTSSGSSSGSSGSDGSSDIGDVGSVSVDDVDSGLETETENVTELPKLYQNLAKSIKILKGAFSGLASVISSGLQWAYNNVLKPLGKWTISKLVPKILDVFSGAIKVLTSAIKALSPLGEWLWDNFLSKLAKFAGNAVVKFLGLLADGLNKLSGWIDKHQTAVQNIATAIGSFFAAFKAVTFVTKIVGPLSNALSGIKMFGKGIISFKTLFSGLFPKMFGVASKAIGLITSPLGIAVVAVGALITAGVLLYKNWDKLKKTKFGKFLIKIANAFKTLLKNIKNLLSPIKNFKKTWEGIKSKKAELEAEAKEKVEGALAALQAGWEAIQDKASELVAEAKEKASGAIESLKEKWESVKDRAAELVAEAKEKAEGAISKLKENWESIKDRASELVAEAKEKVSGALAELKEKWESVKDRAVELAAKIATKWSDLKEKWSGIVDNIKDKTADMKAKVATAKSTIKEKWAEVVGCVKDKTADMKAKIATTKKELKKKWEDLVSNIKGKTISIWVSLKKKASSLWNTITGKKADGGVYKNGRWSPIQRYESGGTPNQGQMFIAREKGPELVGTLGGHTAVMNNNQIVSSVSSGVAKAVSAAMGSVGQSLYSAISNLKIESKTPQIKQFTPPAIASTGTKTETSEDKKIIELLTTLISENKTNSELLRKLITIVSGLDLDITLNGKSVKDDVVRRINNNTKATGKCEIIT